jgi:hypothetical protein
MDEPFLAPVDEGLARARREIAPEVVDRLLAEAVAE